MCRPRRRRRGLHWASTCGRGHYLDAHGCRSRDHTAKHIAMENRLSPMRELLGELLLEASRPAEAQHEFELSLTSVPNRFRSLAGAGRAAALAGHEAQARLHASGYLCLHETQTASGYP
jgi:hypothetical protein